VKSNLTDWCFQNLSKRVIKYYLIRELDSRSLHVVAQTQKTYVFTKIKILFNVNLIFSVLS